MKVLVTGGAGFIGSHIVDLFFNRGHSVYVVDDFSSGKDENLEHLSTSIKIFQGDIATRLTLRMIDTIAPEVIIHQAAQPSLLRSVKEPQFDATVNIIGTLNMIEAARRNNAHMIMASTSAVYDEQGVMPYLEYGMIRPTRPYGIAKLAAEMYLRESGLRYTILRYGNVYGPRQIPVGENQLVPHALNHIFKGAPFVVNGDGEQKRDFVYVEDIALANYQAAMYRENGTFNAAHGISHSVNEVLHILKSLTNFTGNWRHGEPKPKEPRDVTLDSRAAYRKLEFKAQIPLIEGLGRTVQWYQAKQSANIPKVYA